MTIIDKTENKIEESQRREDAERLRRQIQTYSEALSRVRNSSLDRCTREDRVVLSQAKLFRGDKATYDGGARFDNGGNVKTLIVRQSKEDKAVDLSMRTTGQKIKVVEKTSDFSSSMTVVLSVQFNHNGNLVRYRRETVAE